jgi:predicted  nucleic acid-binding Zn-ribbon protein
MIMALDNERVARLETQVEGIKEDVAAVKEDIKELHSRITTGNREIVDKIEAMDKRLEDKLNKSADAARDQHQEIQKEIQQDVEKISNRVDILERWRWMIVGGAIVVGYLIGHVDWLTLLVSK